MFVLKSRAGGGADHIAEIVKDATRHDGIEIDDAHRFTRQHIHHNVVEFSVVVGDAFGDFAFGHCIQNHIHNGFALEGEINFRLSLFGTIVVIVFYGLLKCCEPFPGVMKVGYRFEEAPARQIDEQTLKFAKRAACVDCSAPSKS